MLYIMYDLYPAIITVKVSKERKSIQIAVVKQSFGIKVDFQSDLKE